MEWVIVLFLHMLVGAGVAILAVGTSGLDGTHPTATDLTLTKSGAAILTVAWVLVTSWGIASLVLPADNELGNTWRHRHSTIVSFI
jgi:hypothetical protein